MQVEPLSTILPNYLRPSRMNAARLLCLPLAGLSLLGCVSPLPPKARPAAAVTAPQPAELAAVPEDPARAAAARRLAEAQALYDEYGVHDKPLPEGTLEAASDALRLSQAIGDPEGQIKSHLLCGRVLAEMDDLPAAVLRYQEGLNLALRTESWHHAAIALRRLGMVEIELQNPEVGVGHLTEALRIWEERSNLEEQRTELFNLGVAYFRLMKLDRALSYYERALPLVQASDDRASEAQVLSAMALIHSDRGEIDLALEQFDRALRMCEKACDSQVRGAVFNCVASLYRRTGAPEKALELLYRALRSSEGLNDRLQMAKNHNYLAWAYRELGDLDKAVEHDHKALELHRARNDKVREADTLSDLGWIDLDRNELGAALEKFEAALKLLDGYQVQSRSRAIALQGLGAARRQLGDLPAALAPLEEALSLRAEAGDRLSQASVLIALGQVRQALRQDSQATADFERALVHSRDSRAYTLQAEALFRLARLDRDRGRLPEAQERIHEALQILERVREGVAVPFLRSTFLGSRREYQELEVDVLMRMADRDPVYREKAFKASERAHARGLLDLLTEGPGLDQGISPELKREETEVGKRLTRVQRLLVEELSGAARDPDPIKIASLRQDLDEIEEDRGLLELRIRREHPRYAQVRYPEPLDLEAVRQQLDENTALLEYFLGEEGSFLFVVTRGGLEVHRLPAAAVLRREVRKVRAGLEKPGGSLFTSYKRAAASLYDTLIGPARTAVAGKRLLIVPDEDLHLLSFEALLTRPAANLPAGDLPYLLHDHAVVYVPSASVLGGLREPAEALAVLPGETPKRFLAFADPVMLKEAAQILASGGPERERSMTGGDRLDLERLPGSADEVRKIAGLYSPEQVQVYLRGDASEGNVKGNRLLGLARRIHFATHGIVNEERPDLSALVLTSETGAEEDGFLQVHEIFNLQLSADLVVLSACETALGKQISGEGLLGLTRAFLHAGARSVVVSLWRVADQASTPDLMVRFYGQLDRPVDKAEALRQAKLETIRQGHAHPYYWAPFVLIGDPDGAVR